MRPRLSAALLCVTLIDVAHADWTKFEPLGDLPGSYFASEAHAISGDGTTVVGVSDSERSGWNGESFVWTEADGMIGLGNFQSPYESEARDVSADGKFVVGTGSINGHGHAFRWSAEEGMIDLGDLPGGDIFSGAVSTSADGAIVVGTSISKRSNPNFEAITWTAGDGMQPLSKDFKPFWPQVANGISADGSVIIGWYMSGWERGFRWTAEDGLVDLGELERDKGALARSVSADGSTIVGWSFRFYKNVRFEVAVRWTDDTGPQPLYDDYLSYVYGNAESVSADGSVIVGRVNPHAVNHAFIWSTDRGFRLLEDDLLYDYGVQLDGYKLDWAYGVSDDGRTIAGWSTNPDYNREAYRLHLGTFRLGDVNCDEAVNFADIDAFVVALASAEDYAAQYPDCRLSQADINRDGAVDFNDIDPFVCCLIAGSCYDCGR